MAFLCLTRKIAQWCLLIFAAVRPASALLPPGITSASPLRATAGSAGFTLTVYGHDLSAACQVKWNGSGRATTYSNQTLFATIAAADVLLPGTKQITATCGANTTNA